MKINRRMSGAIAALLVGLSGCGYNSLVSTEELYQAAIELAIPGCEPSISGAAARPTGWASTPRRWPAMPG